MQSPPWIRWHEFIQDPRISRVREIEEEHPSTANGRPIGRHLTLQFVFSGKLACISKAVLSESVVASLDYVTLMRDQMRLEAIEWLGRQV